MQKKKWTSGRVMRTLLVLTLVAGLVVAVVAMLIQRGWHNISERYIQTATQRAATEFYNMTIDVEASLKMMRDWGGSGMINAARPEKAKELLFPLFGKRTALSGISVADTSGHGYFMQPDGSLSDPSLNKEYDYEDRPWFKPALTAEGASWSSIYRFFTSKQHGITASISWTEGKGKKQTVGAVDILLDDFFNEVQGMAPTPASRAFIFLPDGRLYVPEAKADQAEFHSIDVIQDGLVLKGLTVWNDDGLGDGEVPELKVVQMNYQGEAWWCGFVPLEKARKTVWMGVLVPESDIVGDILNRRRMILGIGVLLFLVFVGLYAFSAWRNRGVRSDATEAFNPEDPEGSIRSIISGGENRYVEFKSTMRMNLHTKKPGKEIELAWMKGVAGFLNTDGGILLIGVTDDGEISGLERDVFENDDKCKLHFKNLISKHIGADLSKYIRFTTIPMEEKTVGVVRCNRAEEPAFMKDGNKEHFYIRNGPSSDELPVSQALNYIKHRK